MFTILEGSSVFTSARHSDWRSFCWQTIVINNYSLAICLTECFTVQPEDLSPVADIYDTEIKDAL